MNFFLPMLLLVVMFTIAIEKLIDHVKINFSSHIVAKINFKKELYVGASTIGVLRQRTMSKTVYLTIS